LMLRSSIFDLLFPVEWHIHITKEPDGRYRLKYTEVVRRPEEEPKEVFLNRITATLQFLRLLRPLGFEVKIDLTDKENCTITLEGTGSRDFILNMVASEFLSASPLGDATVSIRDILMTVGLFRLFEFKKE